MVDINIANFITIGLISVIGYAGLKYLLTMLGFMPAWL
jgi:hypothetical protein